MTKKRNEYQRVVAHTFEFVCHDCDFKCRYRTEKDMKKAGIRHRKTKHNEMGEHVGRNDEINRGVVVVNRDGNEERVIGYDLIL